MREQTGAFKPAAGVAFLRKPRPRYVAAQFPGKRVREALLMNPRYCTLKGCSPLLMSLTWLSRSFNVGFASLVTTWRKPR